LNVAISNIMVKKTLLGRDKYDQIETGVCDEIGCVLKEPSGKLLQYLPIISKENRDTARMYFVKDAQGLEISAEQLRAYAKKHNKIIMDIPDDQMAIVYYTVRVARLLEVGMDIDKVIVWGVNNKIIDRSMELQEEVRRCLV
jgi:hypothetical protein